MATSTIVYTSNADGTITVTSTGSAPNQSYTSTSLKAVVNVAKGWVQQQYPQQARHKQARHRKDRSGLTCRPVPMVGTMTLEQALAFRIYGKALREMKSPSDWRRLFLKIEQRQAMIDAFWRHQWDDEMDQRAHASADRLDDLMTALGIIFAEA